MKNTKVLSFAVVLVLMLSLSACLSSPAQSGSSKPEAEPASSFTPSQQSCGQIYLYGERHGVKKILDGELELWYSYYHNENMRHLFIEYPYYTAELLNQWMRMDSDIILNEIYNDWTGSAAHSPGLKEFFKQIKLQCPETVFHGTDVGHQYDTTGERLLKTLRDSNQQDSEQYKRAQEVMEQGKYFYSHADDIYRENKMVENFICEFDKLNGEDVMGIYGSAHTGLDAMDHTQSVACMANQLKGYYGGSIHSKDLSKVVEPEKIDVIVVNGKEYQALYFGKEELSGNEDYAYREFWRLENAYDDFKDKPESGDVLPCDNYPMFIEPGQVFVIDYVKTDGAAVREYYLFNGQMWKGRPTTKKLIMG